MSIAVISAQTITSSQSLNLVSGNSNAVIFAFQNAINSSTPPTFNGVNLTLWGQVGYNNGGLVFLWYMQNPPDGSLTFVPNGFSSSNCNIYSFSGVSEGAFVDTDLQDFGDVVNTGVTLTPNYSGGILLFFQQANTGSGTITLTAGQTNKLFLGFGATMVHASPGAGVSYASTVTYAPAFGNYDQFGLALIPASVTTTSTTITTSTTTTSSSTSSSSTSTVSISTTTTSSSSTSSTSTSHSTTITTTSSSTTTTSSSSTSTHTSSSSISTSSTSSTTLSSSTTLTIPRGSTDSKSKVFVGKTREH